MSLFDVLAPPENRWLMELSRLSRQKTELPAGVRVVRFGKDDDDPLEDRAELGPQNR
jgi:hypothetical protein